MPSLRLLCSETTELAGRTARFSSDNNRKPIVAVWHSGPFPPPIEIFSAANNASSEAPLKHEGELRRRRRELVEVIRRKGALPENARRRMTAAAARRRRFNEGMFDRFDTNGDGVLVPRALLGCWRGMIRSSERLFARMDVNGDGEISSRSARDTPSISSSGRTRTSCASGSRRTS